MKKAKFVSGLLSDPTSPPLLTGSGEETTIRRGLWLIFRGFRPRMNGHFKPSHNSCVLASYVAAAAMSSGTWDDDEKAIILSFFTTTLSL